MLLGLSLFKDVRLLGRDVTGAVSAPDVVVGLAALIGANEAAAEYGGRVSANGWSLNVIEV